MDRLFASDDAAGELDRAIADHFVGIHVRLRARSRLEHNQWELGVEPAVDHFLCSLRDERHFFGRQLAQCAVRFRRAFLQHAKRADDGAAPAKPVNSDREIVDRALRLRTPQMIGRHADFAERILLDAIGIHERQSYAIALRVCRAIISSSFVQRT